MKRALLVIDVQNEYFTGRLPVSYPENSLSKICQAMEAANEKNLPIILIQHTAPQKDAQTFVKDTFEWEIHEEILNKKFDYIIEKTLPGSFTGTELERILKGQNIDTVVISGYMTQMCCDTTSRQAVHLGYNVEFLSDATGTLTISNYTGTISDADLHNAILVTQAMGFSQVLTVADWIKKIQN